MRFSRTGALLAAIVVAVPSPASAQYQPSIPAMMPLQFESWRMVSPVEVGNKLTVRSVELASRKRSHQALLGGFIGAAAGVTVCTVFSTLIDDSAEGGISFCPLDTNLLFGGAGFALGAAIGWSI